MRHSPSWFLALLALALGLPMLAAQRPSWITQLGYRDDQIYPLKRGWLGMPFVEVAIGANHEWLLFDTGNMVGLSLATNLIDRLHLPEIDHWDRLDAAGHILGRYRKVRAPSLHLFGQTFVNQPVFEIGDTALGGLVGPDALPGTRFTLDYTSQLMAVGDGALGTEGATFVALSLIVSTLHPRLVLAMVTLNGHPVLAEFDTGASRTSVDPQVAADLAFPTVRGGVRIDSLVIGSLAFTAPSARLDSKGGIDPGLRPALQLSVGSDVLSQLVVTVDYAGGHILLRDTRRN